MKDKIIDIIKKHTNHKNVILTDSGNKAIYAAFYYVKKAGVKEILIPDQGGWLTYKDYPMKFGLDVVEIKTDCGLIDLRELAKHKNKALILPTYAGYFAKQDMRQICKICKDNNILLIEDVNNFSEKRDYESDIIVCSFGKWKIVDNHHGGFISSNEELKVEKENIEPKDLDYEKLYNNLLKAEERLGRLLKECEKVKRDLKKFDIIHRDRQGIVVVVRYDNEEEKKELLEYCKEHSYETTECPRYIRVNEKAVSIEVKRLKKEKY